MTAGGQCVLDVAQLLEGQRSRMFAMRLLLLSWLITVFDGLDLMMISFTAPYVRDELHLSPQQLGELFSSGTLGQILGGFVFCYLADRVGRRPVIVATAFTFGILTMATALAASFPQLLLLRFFDGMAIGGMLPIAWALNIEFAPRHRRGTVVTIIMLGYSIGAASAGPMTNAIAPFHGWQGVFIAGGLGTLVISVLLLAGLPESLRFLVSTGRSPKRIATMIRRFDPTCDATEHDRFILGDEPAPSSGKARSFRVGDLFAGDLALITPLLWLGYMASALAIYFNGNWGPLLLEYLKVPRHTAALVASSGGLIGALAGVALLHLTERRGKAWLLLYPALALPVLLLLGFGVLPQTLFLPFVVLAAMFVGGGHASVVSIAGLFYPSSIRANGGGWATSVAKIGGVAGPLIGGAVLASGLPVMRTYALLAICPTILFACLLLIVIVVRRRDDSSSASVPTAAEG